jgi:hypothetical protein
MAILVDHVVGRESVPATMDRPESCIPKSNVHLKVALVETGNSAAKTKGTYLRDKSCKNAHPDAPKLKADWSWQTGGSRPRLLSRKVVVSARVHQPEKVEIAV